MSYSIGFPSFCESMLLSGLGFVNLPQDKAFGGILINYERSANTRDFASIDSSGFPVYNASGKWSEKKGNELMGVIGDEVLIYDPLATFQKQNRFVRHRDLIALRIPSRSPFHTLKRGGKRP